MKKFLSVLAALTLSVSMLAGCGNKANQTEPAAVPESSQEMCIRDRYEALLSENNPLIPVFQSLFAHFTSYHKRRP